VEPQREDKDDFRTAKLRITRFLISNPPTQRNQPAPANTASSQRTPTQTNPATQQGGGGQSSSSKLPTPAPKPPTCVTSLVLDSRQVLCLMSAIHHSSTNVKFAGYVITRFLTTLVCNFRFFKAQQAPDEEEPQFHPRRFRWARMILRHLHSFPRTLLSCIIRISFAVAFTSVCYCFPDLSPLVVRLGSRFRCSFHLPTLLGLHRSTIANSFLLS